MKFDQILGFHGVIIRTERLEEDARGWSRALSLPVLHRSARAIVVGSGPEFFVELRRARSNEQPGPEEVHVAVRGLSGRGAPDGLGGVCVRRTVGATTLVVREFVSAPSKRWRSRRRRR